MASSHLPDCSGLALGPLLTAFSRQWIKDDSVGLAVAQELQRSAALRSFTLRLQGLRVSDACGLAVADLLLHSRSLRSFSMIGRNTNLRDISGLAIARALQQNTCLRSFSIRQGHLGMCVPSKVASPFSGENVRESK